MKNHPHGYNYGKLLRQIFPEVTKTPLRIAIWTLIYMVNAALILYIAQALGLPVHRNDIYWPRLFPDMTQYTWALVGIIDKCVFPFWLLVALIPFSVEAFLYTLFMDLRK